MTHQKRTIFTSLKSFLFLITVISLLVMLSASVAADGGGTSPTTSVSLADEVDTGSLDPSDQHWYTFTSAANEVEKSLTLVITPDNGNTIKFINLSVFEANQIEFFSEGETTNMATFGASQVVTTDDDAVTGERLWTSAVSDGQTYYIQILNDSDFSVTYTLSNAEVVEEVTPEEPETPAETTTTTTTTEEPALETPDVSVSENDGSDPGRANVLEFTSNAPVLGSVAANSTSWYTFEYPYYGEADTFKDLNYTFFATPSDGNRQHRINFELFPYSEFNRWQRGDGATFTNFGAGQLVSRDGDDLTVERLWSGTINKGDKYLMSIANGTDVNIDYWLFNGDIINPILGPLPEPQAALVYAAGASPQTAQPLAIGVNKGGLDDGEEAWYSFRITDDFKGQQEMALTMIATPGDGNRVHKINFDVFTAGGAQNWSPGDNTQISNMGAGSTVVRDNNDETAERFWTGWVIDNDKYLVQIRNGTGVHMDYHLFTGDVYGPELGEKTAVVAQIAADPGKAPSTAQPLTLSDTTGQLEPGTEQWYNFSRGDVGAHGGSVETIFTMIFTPDDGNRIRQINFELFEGNQLRGWSPDNRFGIQGFGSSEVVSRDNEPETGELLWKGHVIAGDTYYMRVSNESDVTIDYTVYPKDVIDTDLQK